MATTILLNTCKGKINLEAKKKPLVFCRIQTFIIDHVICYIYRRHLADLKIEHSQLYFQF